MRSRRKCHEFSLFWGKVFGGLFFFSPFFFLIHDHFIQGHRNGIWLKLVCKVLHCWKTACNRIRQIWMCFNHYQVISFAHRILFSSFPKNFSCNYTFTWYSIFFQLKAISVVLLPLIPQFFYLPLPGQHPNQVLMSIIHSLSCRLPWQRPPCLYSGPRDSWAAPQARWEATATASLAEIHPSTPEEVRPDC